MAARSAASKRAPRKIRERIDSLALIVRRIPLGEADLMVTLLTRERGTVSAIARSARRVSTKLGALEPMHTLRVALELSAGDDIAKLRECRIDTPRLRLLDDERRLASASELLAHARAIVGEGPHEDASFDAVERGLDAIAAGDPEDAAALSAWAGARLLAAAGWALELEACVRCGTPCPPGSAALLDPAAGGLVCRACGGGPIHLGAASRAGISAWLSEREGKLDDDDAALASRIVALAVGAHGKQRAPFKR